MTNIFECGYALLIGVGQSRYPDWSLPVTVKDIQALHKVLVDPNLCAYPNNEQHIRLLHDHGATRQAILDELRWLQQQTKSNPEATVIVYYSGHGWLDKKQNRYHLVQHDIKPFDLPGSALAAEDFTSELNKIQAKRLLVLIDCCHAQGMASAKDEDTTPELPEEFVSVAPSKGLFEVLTQGEGRSVFTSCRGSQKSWIRKDSSMSIYTYHLIEALQGAANQPGDTVVKVSDLMKHLSRTVPENTHTEWQAEQVPWFSNETEDFAIALLQGGKGLPTGGWETVKEQANDQMQVLVQAVGERSVAAGRNISGTVITGDRSISIGSARDVNLEKKE